MATRGVTAVAVVLMAAALAACGGSPGSQPGSGGDRLHRQAVEELARWDAATRTATSGFVPVGDLTGQVGDWEPAVGENAKQALGAGKLVAAAPLPSEASTPGRVTWPDGTTVPVRVVSAAATLKALQQAGAVNTCDACTPLQVTAAKRVEVAVTTSRGPSRAPAWAYTLRGTAVTVTRVAVDPAQAVTVTPPSWDPYDAPGGIAIESAVLAADGVTLTADFTGSPGPASQPCGADYTATAIESQTAVVVLVNELPYRGDANCNAVGAARTAVARLAKPLGSRSVLEIQQGLPIPVTR